MPKLHNRKNLKQIRKSLRNNSTSAEASLWKTLRKSQVGGFKFRRQHSVSSYILDFYCPQLKLAIELDGEVHANPANLQHDIDRDNWLNRQGITVFHYENR